MANPIKELAEKIAEAEKIANIEIEICDPKSRAGMACAKRQAQDDLLSLRQQYLQAVNDSTVGIVCVGPGAATFVAAFTEESSTPVVSVNLQDFYQDLAKYSEESMTPSREWGVTQQRRLIDSLSEVGRNLNALSIVPPRFEESGVLKTFADTTAHVRNLVRAAMGDDLAALYIRHKVSVEAQKINNTSAILPVMVLGLDKEEAKSLTFGKLTEIVNCPESVDAEFTKSVFMRIKKQLHAKN